MAPKDSFAFERQGGHAEIDQAQAAVHSTAVMLVGSWSKPLPLGRFLLSSIGVHLILAWAIISVGLPKVPSAPQPLVVTIIQSPSSESAAPSGSLVRARTRQSTAPAGPKQAVQPRLASSPPLENNQKEAQEEGARPLPTVAAMEPKAIGMSAGGSDAAGAGTPGTLAAGGLSAGPVLLSPDGDSGGASGQASRSGTGRLDASLAAPLTPSVTIGSPQSGTGGRADRASNGAASGGFAAPNYGINPLPKYPPLAREKGYEGTVYLRVMVKVDGRVGQLAVDRSSGYEILDRTAVDSVQEWAFFPAKKGGRPVASWVLLPVKFALN